MEASSETSLVSTLETRLLALQKQISEIDQKCNTLSGTAGKQVPETQGMTDFQGNSMKLPDVFGGPAKAKVENEEPSPYSRVKIIKTLQDPATGERIERQDDTHKAKLGKSDNLAFVLRKNVHNKFMVEANNSEIDIQNPGLWKLLKDHLGDYPFHLFRSSPVTLYSPYEAIVFSWDILKDAAAEEGRDEKDKLAREDLKALLDILSGGSSGDAKLDKYFRTRDIYLRDGTIQFDDIWTIFPPGTLVYGRPFQNEHQVFIVMYNSGCWPQINRHHRPLTWYLDCWTYDWTGSMFQRTGFRIPFEHFEGQRPITTLPYYPFELHSHRRSIQSSLVERGKRFRQLCTARQGSRLFEYEGESIFDKKGFPGLVQGDEGVRPDTSYVYANAFQDDGDTRAMHPILGISPERRPQLIQAPEESGVFRSSYVKSRVMVDYTSYFRYGSPTARNGILYPTSTTTDCLCSDCEKNEGLLAKYRTRFDKDEMQQNWKEEQYLLCPPRVLGYVLKEKQWAQLQVTFVQEIPPSDLDNAWHTRLQLADPKTKDLLFDLVQSHRSKTERNTDRKEAALEVDDIVPGKGKGLVILLYGPPGVGKTSTAETIAVATGKPLLSIGVSDVGTRARHVESNLSKIFALATSWQAILLLDEADVFLESRGRGMAATTDRNALVSVFLRVLEYYQGIMFLTTNQIAQFDVAIPSRIHISVRYESLKPAQMEQIFKGFLQPLDEKRLVDNYADILEWLKEDVYIIGFDGRQIRNIITTALGLARAEAKHGRGKGNLTKQHLRAVVNNTRSFKSDFTVQYDRYINAQEKLIQ